MRCGCPECEAYMIQSEHTELACVCPDCGYRCNACMGTNTVLSPQQLKAAQKELLQRVQERSQDS